MAHRASSQLALADLRRCKFAFVLSPPPCFGIVSSRAKVTRAKVPILSCDLKTLCAVDRSQRRSVTKSSTLPALALASLLTFGLLGPCTAIPSLANPPASSAQVVKHIPLGQKIATALKKHGISDEAVVFTVSAMPVVELRGGIPLGFLFGMHPVKVFTLAVAGNMLPVFAILAFLRLAIVRRIADPLLNRARRMASSIGDSESLATALALFVGVPLPGTGAFTGTFIAFVLDMSIETSLISVGAGVLMAACIMTLLSSMGKSGAAIAIVAMLVVGIASILRRCSPQASRTIYATDEKHMPENASQQD
jgi:uncharacterized membrane protein